MGFLDNLESSLKSLESQEERDGNEGLRREEESKRRSAEAPWAESLRESPFTQKLFEAAVATGHRLRTKIYVAWLDTTLRLEARGRRLELRPTPDGIVAVFMQDLTAAREVDRERTLRLDSDPDDLLREWLADGPAGE